MKRFLQTPPQSAATSLGLLALRLVIGLAFVMHGWGKIQHPFNWMGPDAGTPGLFQALAAVSEFAGGLGWLVGLLVPLAALGLLSTMTVAVYTHAVVQHLPLVNPAGGGSFELPAAYLCVAFTLLLAGPGRFSLDHFVFGERR